MKQLGSLIGIMREAREFLALPDNDFVWSRWEDQQEALAEIDEHIKALELGSVSNLQDLKLLFAPTGPLQEVSFSGWGQEFLKLAARFDYEIEKVIWSSQ